MNQKFQKLYEKLAPKKQEMMIEMFDLVFEYAAKFGYEGDDEEGPSLLTSESLFQRDDPQIEGLELAGKLVDILNGENNL